MRNRLLAHPVPRIVSAQTANILAVSKEV